MVKITDKKMETERMVLNFGPQHPSTHGTLRIAMELEGETVMKGTPEIGYLHSGFEKLGEYLDYNQYITITDRMNYLSPLCNNVAYALAAEKLIGLEVSKRTEYIRVLMCELSRIADHILNVGMLAVDLGAMTAFLYGFQLREDIYDLFEIATGTRLTTSYTLVGGLMRDIPEGFDKAVLKVLDEVGEVAKDVETLLNKNRIWQIRTKNIGIITKDDAISYGISGPMARASGIDWDIRVNEPYSRYNDGNPARFFSDSARQLSRRQLPDNCREFSFFEPRCSHSGNFENKCFSLKNVLIWCRATLIIGKQLEKTVSANCFFIWIPERI